MRWSSRAKQVKLPVQILIVSSDCHASLAGFRTSDKAELILVRRRRAATPRKDAQFHPNLLANEMPLLGKQLLFHHAEYFREKLNLFAGCRTPLDFNVRQNLAGHVDAPEQMQFGNEIALRPAALVAQPRDLPSDYICVFWHLVL
jgi:hypothetical protein